MKHIRTLGLTATLALAATALVVTATAKTASAADTAPTASTPAVLAAARADADAVRRVAAASDAAIASTRVARTTLPKPLAARVAAAKAKPKPKVAVVKVAATGTSSKLAKARAILKRHIKKHPILRGTTVTIGKTPGGRQAVAYYTTGRIVINPKHRASLERILAHEIWHVIDWRDNHRINWGENVPPRR